MGSSCWRRTLFLFFAFFRIAFRMIELFSFPQLFEKSLPPFFFFFLPLLRTATKRGRFFFLFEYPIGFAESFPLVDGTKMELGNLSPPLEEVLGSSPLFFSVVLLNACPGVPPFGERRQAAALPSSPLFPFPPPLLERGGMNTAPFSSASLRSENRDPPFFFFHQTDFPPFFLSASDRKNVVRIPPLLLQR